ncbi:hypothetical protein RFI_26324, partial [Reticulomyxa filosa]
GDRRKEKNSFLQKHRQTIVSVFVYVFCRTEKRHDESKSERNSSDIRISVDKYNRRKRMQTVGVVTTPISQEDTKPTVPIPSDEQAWRLQVPVKDSAGSFANPKPSSFSVQSKDPKLQELERETMQCKAQLRTEKEKLIEDLEMKFREFEMRLDRCLTKQCLRVQKHRQVIQVYETQNRIHQLEEQDHERNEKSQKKKDKQSNHNDKSTTNASQKGHESDSENDNDDDNDKNGNDDDDDDDDDDGDDNDANHKSQHKQSEEDTQAKIEQELSTIQSISMKKEFDKYKKKLTL